MTECMFCGQEPRNVRRADNRDAYIVDCHTCGTYYITGSMVASLPHDSDLLDKRHVIAGLIREADRQGVVFQIVNTSVSEIVSQARTPQTPFDVLDRLLLVIHDRMADPVNYAVMAESDYPLIYVRNGEQLSFYLQLSERLGWVESAQRQRYRLTLDGWRRIEEIRRTAVISNQGFVAMWFNKELDEAWSEGFLPSLADTGYEPVRVDLVQHNDKIDDRIVAEIRRSGLLIADFTGGRGGVYFEAGFAMGLGIPVIWTCREDWVDRLHFDTRQYNHITWDNPQTLRERLTSRIEATIPGRIRRHVKS